ncbi:sigma-54-dependent transcriptional regulator [Emergencia timonensis]|uniref:sigma-54-dependent transcriptional regulator n=1 Tax=Emergencia timonensis TaxID=1776384 RepID=UPI00399379AA
MKEKILIIDDEVNICTSLVLALKTKYEVMIVDNASDGLFCFQADHFSVCLIDLNVDSRNEMELIKEIKEIDDKVIIIIMTAYTSVRDSMEAIKNGAYTYLIKPLDIQELFLVIKRALKYRYLDERVEYLSQKLEEKNTYHGIIGKSPQMQDVFQMIEKVKNLTTSVLVTGKSGTGKELAARALHYSSGRKQYHFEDVNCAAIPESLLEEELFGHKKGSFTGAIANKMGRFEYADNGTIFLDEIGDMSLSLQAKLLRVLQQREVTPIGSNITKKLNIRVIAATNKDLKKMVEEGSFRSDLYFRLKVIEIKMPELKAHRQDIPLLCSHFIHHYNQQQGKNVQYLTKEAEKILMTYHFPGNIRELSNILEYAMIMCDGKIIKTGDLPEEVQAVNNKGFTVNRIFKEDLSGLTLKEAEKKIILQALEENQWNRRVTAKKLGISDKGLRNKITEYELVKTKKVGK